MSMIAPSLDTLLRPAMLVKAARCGQQHYRRERDLPRLLRLTAAPAPGVALRDLVELEQDVEEDRRNRAGPYDVAEHVAILIALLAEARLSQDPRPAEAR